MNGASNFTTPVAIIGGAIIVVVLLFIGWNYMSSSEQLKTTIPPAVQDKGAGQ